MKKIYICSPYRADDNQGLMENIKLARKACGYAVQMGNAPICPQLYFSQFIDEEKERDIALKAGLALVSAADELWIIGSRVSSGMAAEIHEATKNNIPVKCVVDPRIAEERLLEAIFSDEKMRGKK